MYAQRVMLRFQGQMQGQPCAWWPNRCGGKDSIHSGVDQATQSCGVVSADAASTVAVVAAGAAPIIAVVAANAASVENLACQRLYHTFGVRMHPHCTDQKC